MRGGAVGDGATVTDLLVVGAGPAGLMAALTAAERGAAVVVAEARRSAGRKLLLAGRSGLNLANAEPHGWVTSRYSGSAAAIVSAQIDAFDADAVRAWCASLGVETFVGSTGRVFPVGMRAAPLLRAWLRRLDTLGVRLLAGRSLIGLGRRAEGWAVELAGEVANEIISARTVVLALGGASWPSTGSDAAWVPTLAAHGVEIVPFAAANVGVTVMWSTHLLERFEGGVLKNVAVRVAGGEPVRGELVVTRRGLEGGPVYALGPELRASVPCAVCLDLRPDVGADVLAARVERAGAKATLSRRLAAAGLQGAAAALVNEAIARGWAPRPASPRDVAALVRAVPVRADAMGGLARAISSAGGVHGGELDATGMLHRMPGVWACGEMCDWEAPTGGYLLHGCVAGGRAAGLAAAARAAAERVNRPSGTAS